MVPSALYAVACRLILGVVLLVMSVLLVIGGGFALLSHIFGFALGNTGMAVTGIGVGILVGYGAFTCLDLD